MGQNLRGGGNSPLLPATTSLRDRVSGRQGLGLWLPSDRVFVVFHYHYYHFIIVVFRHQRATSMVAKRKRLPRVKAHRTHYIVYRDAVIEGYNHRLNGSSSSVLTAINAKIRYGNSRARA